MHHPSLPEDDLSASSDLELPRFWLNSRSHVIDDDSLLLRSVVVEAGRPSFEGLEAEGEAILSGWETAAVVDHHFVAGEHVPGLEVLHLVVSVGGCADVLRPEVALVVLL